MRLNPGSHLGPYEILAPLGAGGMGEVYKARDTRLGREVAIKILPAERVADEERRRRFIQEARAASALNHPNIVTVHDISESSGTDFLVMEYVRGKTIDQLIGRSGMRVSEALRCAVQIADALARAHAAGIVHRDLKPGNVMLNEDGVVKVLDFGLAKLAAQDDVGDSQTTLTMSAGLTPKSAEGAIVGTVAYMSPEQAEGKRVDARSDIFSFGSMLYEMVTGHRAFSGNSSASTLAAVLKEDPKPPTLLAEAVPKELERIILRCLRKDPARRFQITADLKVDLEEVKEESDSAGLSPERAASPRSRRWAAGAVVVATILAAAVWALRPQRETALPALKLSPLTTYPGLEYYPSFAPDGNQVAFAWNGEKQDNWDIYVKVVGSGAPQRLTSDPAEDRFPTWSPDGLHIAFSRGGAIFLFSPPGGPERKLVDFEVSSPMSWSPDGKWIAATQRTTRDRPGGLFLVPLEGGENVRITSRNQPLEDKSPAFSPDGRRLAFVSCSSGISCDVHVLELGTGYSVKGEPRRLTRRGTYSSGLAWTPNGQALVFSAALAGATADRLWKVPVADSGEPEQLDLFGNGIWPATSAHGNRLAYSTNELDLDIWIFDKSGSRKHISSTRDDTNAQFSRDGKRIAFVSTRSGVAEIWVANVDGSRCMQLTFSQRDTGTPRWSPDGRWIAYDALIAEGSRDIWVIDSSGGRSAAADRTSGSGSSPQLVP